MFLATEYTQCSTSNNFVRMNYDAFYVTGYDEYCLDETFSATCMSDEVILISKAQYGRMRMGKCVKSESE